MQLRVTSVTGEDVAALFRDATVDLETALARHFAGRDYGGGIDQFVVVAVSVDSDAAENERFCGPYNKVGSYKSLVTGERVRYISFACALDPAAAIRMSEGQVAAAICKSLSNHLDNPPVRVPKQFDHVAFAGALRVAIEALGIS
jgi:hypothetical protein